MKKLLVPFLVIVVTVAVATLFTGAWAVFSFSIFPNGSFVGLVFDYLRAAPIEIQTSYDIVGWIAGVTLSTFVLVFFWVLAVNIVVRFIVTVRRMVAS